MTKLIQFFSMARVAGKKVRGLPGVKGANLGEMTKIKNPVPPWIQ
ncbi:hypothetical protein [Desulfobacula phenolica]|nr:hypothetical protein [Desulfobacula phenolica]